MKAEVEAAMEEYDVRPFAPIQADDALVGKVCPACRYELGEGEVPCLIVMDTPYNREKRAKAGGGFYTAEATPAHWTCITGSDTPAEDWEEYAKVASL